MKPVFRAAMTSPVPKIESDWQASERLRPGRRSAHLAGISHVRQHEHEALGGRERRQGPGGALPDSPEAPPRLKPTTLTGWLKIPGPGGPMSASSPMVDEGVMTDGGNLGVRVSDVRRGGVPVNGFEVLGHLSFSSLFASRRNSC
jgi:hypothetical protein